MVQEQYTTKRRKGQHLKLIERGKIEAFLKIGMSKVKIAQELGISVRTLHREIKRGMVELLNTDLSTRGVYSAEFAQSKYNKAQKGKEFPVCCTGASKKGRTGSKHRTEDTV